MTRIDSLIIKNPNREVIEDRKKRQGYSLKEIQTVMTRSKLNIFLFDWMRNIDRSVLYFNYPRFSVAWYLFLIGFTYIFNPAYLLTYVTLFFILLVGSYSKEWALYVTPIFQRFFFRESQRNSLIIANHNVKTAD